ncbi:sulfatase-like hydrolase/transferase [Paenibacillus sp. IB182496]|uniref:Sulfatase-like hydrolase/transferase n=1 Tax=Paenibacillus sabuli TaxID=2772509 RepID=A0A927GSK8_9BACL|nr:sulfatase-like hydrolase/transferase [Paenibacillus sabuli]MBD2846391.1 sulfatase-like hydrolase/transferase [Paenibacillus sabuli]
MVPQAYKDLYKDKPIALRPNVKASAADNGMAVKLELLDALLHYYAAITALDDQLGRLTARLDALGLRDNTLLIFTSDHGDTLGSQGYMKKQQPWEESISIPLLLRWPARAAAAQTREQLVGTVDMAPTLLAAAGEGYLALAARCRVARPRQRPDHGHAAGGRIAAAAHSGMAGRAHRAIYVCPQGGRHRLVAVR